MMEMQPIQQQSSSPSFRRYSSESLANIAARVIQELHGDTLFDSTKENDSLFNPQQNDNIIDDIDDFEFSFASTQPHSSPVSADDIFCNGQIRPIYPFCNLFKPIPQGETPPLEPPPRRLPLRKLMLEERETLNDSNDLQSIPAGPYCVWTPSPSPKKSVPRGKRWKLRDLLHWSHHRDGEKESLGFLGPGKKTNKVASKHTSANNRGARAAAKSVGFFW